jgi:hypothetical protein
MDTAILKVEPLYQLAFGSISASYALIGQIENPSQIFMVQNLTNAIITFSNDGQIDNFQLPPNGFLLLDIGSNKSINKPLSFAAGTCLFCKGSPTSGQVNLTTWYMG